MTTTQITPETLPNVGDEITLIDGITYVVEAIDTLASYQAKGLHNVARLMVEDDRLAQIALRRPNGRKAYLVIVKNSGAYTSPIAL